MAQQGYTGKIFYKVGGVAASGAWVEIENSKDFGDGSSRTEGDSSTRAMAPYKTQEPCLISLGFDFEMNFNPADPVWVVLQAAYVAGTVLGFAMCNEDVMTPGAVSWQLDIKVFKFENSFPLDDVAKTAVTVKPCESDTLPSWNTTP